MSQGRPPGPVTAAIRQLQPGQEITLRDVSRGSVRVLACRESKRSGARMLALAWVKKQGKHRKTMS